MKHEMMEDEMEMEGSEENKKKMEEYEVESAMRCVLEAQKYLQDPKMMKAIQSKLDSQKKVIESLADLKLAKKNAMLNSGENEKMA